MNINQVRRERFSNNFSGNVPAAVAGVPGQLDLFTFRVPTKCKLRFLAFGNYTNTVAAWGNIWWIFINNLAPMAPYEAILDQIGYGPQRQQIQALEIYGGSTFIVRAFNNTAGIVQMGVSFEYELEYQE